jgi:hypothetical protein
VVLAGDAPIGCEHLPPQVASALVAQEVDFTADRDLDGDDSPVDDKAMSPEDLRLRDELTRLLREHKGNISAIARLKGKARMQIQRWCKRFRLDPESYRR